MHNIHHGKLTNVLQVTFILITFFVYRSAGQSINQPEIMRINHKWAPDPRIGLCNLAMVNGKGKSVVIKGETMFSGARKEVIAWAARSGKRIIDSVVVLPDTARNPNYRGLVTLSVANIRRQPESESEMVSQAILGTPVTVLKEERGWVFIQTPDKYLGWTEESSLKLLDHNEWSLWHQAKRLIYLENTGWIYGSQDEKSTVGDIVAGAIVALKKEEPGWVEIALPDGRVGFIPENQVSDYQMWKSNVKCTPEGLISVARTFMGIPYEWGGTTAKAADCSGFIQSVYFRNGILLARDASQQCDQGIKVDISNGIDSLKAGDLLFFGTIQNGFSKVTHVALYIGNTEFIHASGMVMIGSLDPSRANYDEYRRKSWLAARRIIGEQEKAGIVTVSEHPWYE